MAASVIVLVVFLTITIIVQTVRIDDLVDERAKLIRLLDDRTQLMHELNYWKGTDGVRSNQ